MSRHSDGIRRNIVFLLALYLLAVGCAQKTPVERMESVRAKYSATLNAFLASPQAGAAAMVDPEATIGLDVDAAVVEDVVDAEGATAAMAEVPSEPVLSNPVLSNIVLDFVIRNESTEKLPGITLDVTMVDAETMGDAEGEKERWTVWIDTSAVGRGPGTQMTHELEGVEYEEGDGFHVEVRHPIPEEERTDYREYTDAS